MNVLILLNLFFQIISIIPNWNLKNASENLLKGNTNTYTYTITLREMYELVGKLEKTITRTEGENIQIIHKNDLYIKEKGQNDTDFKKYENVNFENIESLYKLGSKILCPTGKHFPIKIGETLLEEITNSDIDTNKEWDLKCYRHNHGDGYFFTYFLLNERNQTYQLKNYNTYDKLTYLQLHQDLYDFKLVDKTASTDDAPYPICALVKWGGYIQYMATQYKFGTNMDRDQDDNKTLILAKAYTQGYFSNYSNYF